jgi:3-dehydrosphinganine reductase
MQSSLMPPNRSLALITGGSSGIGLALAKALLQDRMDVCILARDEEKLSQALSELSSHKAKNHQRIYTLSCDVTNFEKLDKSLTQWTEEAGLPNLVINSAGATYPGYFQKLDVNVFHWLMDVNYFGTLHVIKSLIPGMLERGSGVIVNISSQAGFIGVFGYSAYSASKYAIRGLSDVLRAELKPHGIQVSIVFPPDTQTPQLDFEAPLKPIETKEIAGSSSVMTADAVAEAILKGVRKGRYVILPGFEGKFFYRLTNILGNLTYPIMDMMVRRAQKKKDH